MRPGQFNVADRNRLTADFGAETVQLATELATSRFLRRSRSKHKAAYSLNKSRGGEMVNAADLKSAAAKAACGFEPRPRH